jgi:UV DNA damage endonuclease
MLRLGLVCQFASRPIQFRSATAAALSKLERGEALARLSELILENAAALQRALAFCADNGIGAFRISSDVLPLKTHPEAGYEVEELPAAAQIIAAFRKRGLYAQEQGLRLSFHPGQFTVLSSPHERVAANSLEDVECHAEVAEWVGADVVNVHGGGAYGDKRKALARLATNLARLSPRARSRITVENDDRVYTPADLLPFCRAEGVPFVYDVHHHRVLGDGLAVEEVTAAAVETWDREPLFHLSSPKEGWRGSQPNRHHDYVNPRDFPESWKRLASERPLTVDVEAKSKELAVLALLHTLRRQGVSLRR